MVLGLYEELPTKTGGRGERGLNRQSTDRDAGEECGDEHQDCAAGQKTDKDAHEVVAVGVIFFVGHGYLRTRVYSLDIFVPRP